MVNFYNSQQSNEAYTVFSQYTLLFNTNAKRIPYTIAWITHIKSNALLPLVLIITICVICVFNCHILPGFG